jgi:hypothetical protein
MIGNSMSGMRVLKSEEYTKDSTTERKVEVYEYLRLGIAVHADHILAINSKLLGSSVIDYLKANSLFAWPLPP